MHNSESQRILVLAPHTDDAEFGCGGSISRLIDEGYDVSCVVFSDCRQSLPDDWDPETLLHECKSAARSLGLAENRLLFESFPVRQFGQHRQGILEALVKLEKELKPTKVFMPALSDLHQDHHVIASEGLRAFKRTTILSYEMPWNNISFETRCFIEISEKQLNTKIDAIGCYISQQDRNYSKPEFIKSLAITRGTQIGVKYAEVFQVERLVFSSSDRV